MPVVPRLRETWRWSSQLRRLVRSIGTGATSKSTWSPRLDSSRSRVSSDGSSLPDTYRLILLGGRPVSRDNSTWLMPVESMPRRRTSFRFTHGSYHQMVSPDA